MIIRDDEADALAAGAAMLVVIVLAILWKPIATWCLLALAWLHQAVGA